VLLDVAAEEATATVPVTGADPAIVEDLRAVARHTWTPPADGISLHPYPTLLAVLHCIHNSSSLGQAIETAVTLGGDTDTVAALVAGLVAARYTPDQVRAQLPWSSQVQLPDDQQISALAAELAELRAEQADG